MINLTGFVKQNKNIGFYYLLDIHIIVFAEIVRRYSLVYIYSVHIIIPLIINTNSVARLIMSSRY